MILTSLPRKVTAVCLAAAVLRSILSVPVSALEPYGYSMSADYKNSIYYKNLTSLTLTGNGAADVLMVAMSQLGYHEGNGNGDFAGANASGSRNFVEYNRLAGKLDNGEGNGVSYGYAWCASFVNWCLRQAGVSKSVSGGEVSCSRWIREFLKPAGIWKDSPAAGGNYIPEAGDLIFFRRSGSTALSTHVGLVLYADRTYVYTVEGNTSGNCVATERYALDSSYVIGYGSPRYETAGKDACDYAAGGSVKGLYIVTTSDLNVRSAATTASAVVGGLRKAELVRVLSFESGFARIEISGGTAYASGKYLALVAEEPAVEPPEDGGDAEDTEAPPEDTETNGGQPLPPPAESEDEVSEVPSEGAESPEQTEDSPEESVYPEGNAGCGSSVGLGALLLLVAAPCAAIPILYRKRR